MNSLKGYPSRKGYEFLMSDKVNAVGTFVTFFLKNGNERTLILKNVKTGEELLFPNVHTEPVLTDHFMICYNYNKKELYKINLENYQRDELKGVSEYHWIDQYKKMIVYNDSTNTLKIINENLVECSRITNVRKYYISPKKESIVAIANNNQLAICKLKIDYSFSLLKLKKFPTVKTIKWSPNESLIYLVSREGSNFGVSVVKNKKITSVYNGSLIDTVKKTIIDTLFSNVRVFSDRRLGFGVKRIKNDVVAYEPEIWLGASKNLSPATDKKKNEQLQLAILDLYDQKLYNLADSSKLLQFAVNYGGQQVFAYEELDDYSKYIPDINVYKYSDDLKQRIFFDVFPGHRTRSFNVENKKGLFYLKDSLWYHYNGESDKVKSLTRSNEAVFGINNTRFHFKQNDLVRQSIISYDKNKVLFNDFYDIWFYNLKTSTSERKTRGKEQGRHYSLAGLILNKDYESWTWSTEKKLQKTNDLLLQWRSIDFVEEGVALMKTDGEIVQLIKDRARFTQLFRNGNLITYKKERADTPPELYLFNLDTKEEILLYKSNIWDETAKKSKSEYIKFRDAHGNMIGAIVRLPIGYQKEYLYPTIFSIYEDKSESQHYYESPFKNDDIGFNHRHYTEAGYIVVEPDIYYEYGSPGNSATECVLSALDHISALYSVDVKNVGLIGHSFGGYETNYIISQTNRFKTAVSGAGISDIISWYLSVNPASHRPEFWRYPEQSFRMKNGLFDILPKYLQNSPILESHKVTTPLLLWAGKEDYHVNWNQSVEMFLALKKQQKNVNLILYPNEKHILSTQNAKTDLKIKIKSWFDFYLKDSEKPLWLKE